jgi:hypothetical protein
VGKIRSIFGEIAVDRNHVSDFKRVPSPSSPLKYIGTGQFEIPPGNSTARISHVNLKMSVRVCPLDSCYGSRKRYAVVSVVFGGEGVMREREFR